MKRLAALLLAASAALAAGGSARAEPWPCGLPDSHPLWVEFADGSVPFRQQLFGKPGIVVATNGVERAAEMRALGAQTVYWHMFLKGLAGKPTEPADPALVEGKAVALAERAVASSGCETPIIALNELWGVKQPTPWPYPIAQYRANVLKALQVLAARGAHPFLLVPGPARGRSAPYTGGEAAYWWREVAQVATIVREDYFNAPYAYGLGAIVGSRARRLAMRDSVQPFLDLGISPERLGIFVGFHSGPGKGGREGLHPRQAWFTIVKREALAARQVALELGLGSIWSWGWGTFNVEGADADKPAAACVYLWTRDPGLCDGLAAAGPGFDASLTEGQIILPAGVQCSTGAGDIQAAAVEELAGPLGSRPAALAVLLTRLVHERLAGPVAAGEVARAEEALVARSFGGSLSAYEAELERRGLSGATAQALVADQLRAQAIDALTPIEAPGSTPAGWMRDTMRQALVTTVCLGDELPAAEPADPGDLLPFLALPAAKVAIAASRLKVPRGETIVFSGTVTSTRADEVVTLWARRVRGGEFAPVGTARVDGSGAWQLTVKPASTAFYRATSRSAASKPIVVTVRKKAHR